MEKIYADLIRKEKKTLDNVPDNLKAAVKALVGADGTEIQKDY